MAQFLFLSDLVKYKYRSTLDLRAGVLYKYNAATPLYFQSPAIYSYTGQYAPVTYDKIIGWRSPYTQIIANSYQPWHAIRNCPESTGQYLINAMAMHVEGVNRYWADFRKELYLDTADPAQPHRFGRVPVPDNVNLEKELDKQLLINGDFSYVGLNRYKLPYGWSDGFDYSNAQMTIYEGDSVIGGNCVKIEVKKNETAYLAQKSDIIVPAGNHLAASVWYKTYIANGYRNTGLTANLFLKCTKDSASIEIHKEPLKHATNGRWTRAELIRPINDNIGRIEVGIELKNVGEENIIYYVDGFMLEKGNACSEFQRSAIDNPDWMKWQNEFISSPLSVEVWDNHVLTYQTATTGSVIFSGSLIASGNEIRKIPLYQITDPRMFASEYLCPTRIESYQLTGNSTIVGITNKFYGLSSNSGEHTVREAAWDVAITGMNSQRLVRYTWPFKDEVLNKYTIADPAVGQNAIRIDSATNQYDLYNKYTISDLDEFSRSYGYNLNIEAITVKHDKIWAVCKERFSGVTNRILKLIDPKTELTKTYLESITELIISTGAGLTGTVSSVGFVDDSVDTMLITLTGNHLVYSGELLNLKKDYYYLDANRRQILTRELYTGANQKIVIY